MDLRPFQRRFIKAVANPRYDTCALCIPRGNGKSWLAAHLLTRCLTPGDSMHVPGSEYLLVASSIDQSRICFRFMRAALGEDGYRFTDSYTRLGCLHKASRTALRVLSSDGKRAMGIVNTPLLVADEPGSWQTNGGGLMHDAISTAQGKPSSPLRVVYIGTIAPATGGWWPQLIAKGTHGTTYVQSLQGEREKWDRWPEIRRCNPLTAISAPFRAKLRQERDAAQADERLRARFLSYRLNLPSRDSSSMLLTVSDWQLLTARQVAPRAGRPIVAVDLGQDRAWSALVALWPDTARGECIAIAPGTPSIEAQEKRDRVPAGTYERLHAAGTLSTDGTLRVPRIATIVDRIFDSYGRPAVIIGDRARYPELLDAVAGRVPCVSRVTRWFEAAQDIRALRQMARDGPLSIAPESRELLQASLSVCKVKSDDQGSTRLIKQGTNNTARDDVAAALVLAAGALARAPKPASAGAYRICG